MEWFLNALTALSTVGPAVWILWDSRRRWGKQQPILLSLLWAVGAYFFPTAPFVLSAHLTQRPLLPGESRRGGKVWQFCKNLALFWSLYFLMVALLMLASVSVQPRTSAGPQAADVVAGFLPLAGVLFWLFPVGVILMVGFTSRKPDQIETGE